MLVPKIPSNRLKGYSHGVEIEPQNLRDLSVRVGCV